MSKKRFELLSESQWELIEPLLPAPKRRKDKRSRPWASSGACLEGILWVLQTGGMEGFARQVSFSGNLLAAAEAVGGAGRVARRMANVAGRVRWQRSAEVGRDVPGRQLRSG
jgi:hypothetical protein